MRSATEPAQATCDRQGLLLNVLRALSTPGLMGAGHNLVHQVQRGAKQNMFCCELEMTGSQKQHKTSHCTHSKGAASSKLCRFCSSLPKSHQSL